MSRNATAEKVARLPQRPRAGELLLGRNWYMRPDALQGLRVLAEKRLASPNALTEWAEAPVPESFFATIRDGIAYVPINGPMERTWGFWSWLFGSPTYEMLAVEMQRLRDNAAVRATLLAFDTPGGMVNGCGELAGIIRQCDDVKPVFGYATGDCCSAGYYLASATQKVFADRAAIIGSIGTCATFLDTSGWEEQLGIEFIEMVSTQSPRKNADPTTESGRADWQDMLDSLAAVFITDVAANRGVDEATVLEEFGQGGVFVGQQAIDAGLADELGTNDSVHEAVLAALDFPDSDLTEETPVMPGATRTRPKGSAVNPATRTKAEEEKPKDDEKSDEKAEDTPYDDDDDDEEDDDEEETALFSFPAGMSAADQAAAFDASHPDAAAALRAEGATSERNRVLGIHSLSAKVAASPKATKMVVDGMKDPKATKDSVASAIIDAGGFAGVAAIAGRAADEAELDPPSNADGPDAAANADERAAQFVLNAGKPKKR